MFPTLQSGMEGVTEKGDRYMLGYMREGERERERGRGYSSLLSSWPETVLKEGISGPKIRLSVCLVCACLQSILWPPQGITVGKIWSRFKYM